MCAMAHSYVCTMTHSYVKHDSFITFAPSHIRVAFSLSNKFCVIRLIRMHTMSHSYLCHDSFIFVPWLIHICAMTHSYLCHNSFICVPWLIHMGAPWLIHMCHMPPSSHPPPRITVAVSLSDALCVIRRIHICAMTYSCVPWLIHMCAPWLIHMCNVTPSLDPPPRTSQLPYRSILSSVWHDSFTCAPWLIHMCDLSSS